MTDIALIPAAGCGSRFGGDIPKQYTVIAGEAVITHTLKQLAYSRCFSLLVIVISPDDEYWSEEYLPSCCQLIQKNETTDKQAVLVLRLGGALRADTVANGVAFLLENQIIQEEDRIAVHDAARCCIRIEAIKRLMACQDPQGAILALPTVDTLKFSNDQQNISKTVPRTGFWQAQTPQVFQAALLHRALQNTDHQYITDEASAIENIGIQPRLIMGDIHNIKLTTPQDRLWVETYMQSSINTPNIRIGQGYDVHRLVENRPLILGGVTIPFSKGLDGHSDADALLHAITDALLGAAGLNDIGTHFSDSDPQFQGANSRVLLHTAYQKVQSAGWKIVNIDCTIIAQQPKLAPHIAAMRENIAHDLQIATPQINIKGKTNEKLGYLGRQEAIEAQAVVLLMPR